ncbi:LysR substrate-binding domain-containing protein [Oligella sp. HMSC09E12]|uniref:LysR substrate-binding domain-containing protein n=1 Tax=Oligella sp. HMSC09E12 TaxID=1581147 RepID=UPI0008A33429|nr:LysR substrate-binding domain-containing protein [Oligella sp. HMSC09E12]OFV49187.1 LysR family transcriptional regulator [Oligella sp. HMSC09E12]
MKQTLDSLSFKKYPSTTALQCFESSARYLSFTKAAQELNMTQSAVSKQVSQLEEMINTPLFYRAAQRIFLTPAGKRYYLEILDVLKHIEAATISLMSTADNVETLKITSHPTFCARWLVPAMLGFNQAYPLISVEIKEQVGPFFSEEHDVDIAFLYGSGVWAGMHSIKLFDEHCVAVCSPAYLEKISSAGLGVNDVTLLHLISRPSAWHDYFKQQSISIENNFNGPRFDTFYAIISAALMGYGVALVPQRLVEPEMLSGQLVKVWDYIAKGNGSYYMSYPLSLDNSYRVKAMLNWITKYLEQHAEMDRP